MPKLFDLLSDASDKDALGAIRKKASRAVSGSNKRNKKREYGKKFTIRTPDFVALDLETTGLDFRKDRITEVGAVIFCRGKPVEELKILVNPGIAIPDNITELTGISDKTVADSKSFSEVAEEVVRFIGDLLICGHQIDFDISFLNEELSRCGLKKLKNQYIDTVLLSRLLLFDVAGYSLSVVAEYLNIPLENAHRALDDAKASGFVATKLMPMLNDIPLPVRYRMGKFAPYSFIKGVLIASSKELSPAEVPQPAFKNWNFPNKNVEIPDLNDFNKIDTEEIISIFSENGKISEFLDDYAPRGSQIEMSVSCSDAINSRKIFISEAGTGTGKSLAYLIPSAKWALDNNSRVIVSTNTKNLQEQLLEKDIPLVRNIVGKNLTYSALKGRGNYLCISRWDKFISGEIGNISPNERMATLPLIRWAMETSDGDIDAQKRFNRKWFSRVWNFVSADNHGCKGKRCANYESCFLQNARKKALKSNIVVINHALFFSEVSTDSSFLGRGGPIIFDEAHHIKSGGYQYFKTEIDTNRIKGSVELFNNLIKPLEKYSEAYGEKKTLKEFKKHLKKYRKNILDFLEYFKRYGVESQEKDEQGNSIFTLKYTSENFLNLPEYSAVRIIFNELGDFLTQIGRTVEDEDLKDDISTLNDNISQLKADTTYLVEATAEEHVFWMEGSFTKKWIKLCGVPLDIGNFLSPVWRENEHSIIFTSATLAVSDKFDYFRNGIGINHELEERLVERLYESGFSKSKMILSALSGGVAPSSNDFTDFLAESLYEIMVNLRKNTLILFNANKMLDTTFYLLKNKDLAKRGITLLAQNHSGTIGNILKKFKDNRPALLLGSGSFWEGVDLKGEHCEIVVIPRLPFAVPTHPLTKAIFERIEEMGESSFVYYSVPEAVTKFRQGVGRLIRDADDKGAVIVLDNRMVTKNYGRTFIKSVHERVIKESNTERIIQRVSEFFGDGV